MCRPRTLGAWEPEDWVSVSPENSPGPLVDVDVDVGRRLSNWEVLSPRLSALGRAACSGLLADAGTGLHRSGCASCALAWRDSASALHSLRQPGPGTW